MPQSETKQDTASCIREMTHQDLPFVAALHCEVFPGQLLTLLGVPLIQRLYEQFTTGDSHFATVATVENKVVGFVVGTANKNEIFRGFYRVHIVRILAKVATRPAIWAILLKSMGARKAHMKHLMRALFNNRAHQQAASQSVADSQVPNRLMSIGVHESVRGTGVADALVQTFCSQMYNAGIQQVGLSVLRSNQRAIRFYEKTGWQRERTTDTAVYFYRSTNS